MHAICRRLRTSERLSALPRGVTRHHLVLGFLVHERPLDRRGVYRYLARTSPVEVEVTLLSLRRPPRHARPERRAGDRRPPRAGAGADGARRSTGARTARRACRCAATSWRTRSGSSRGPSSGGCSPQLAEAAYAGEVARPRAGDRSRPPARHNPSDDRRLRRLRGGAAPRRHAGPRREPTAATSDGGFVWIGLYEPTTRSSTRSRASSSCTRSRWRTPSTRTSGPKLEVYEDMVFIVLKTARYVDPRRSSRSARSSSSSGDDFIITVRHGEASRSRGPRGARGRPGRCCASAPGAVLHAILDRVVDDYVPAIEGLENDIDEVEEQLFSRAALNPRRAHLPAQARGARSSGGRSRRWSIRWTASRAGTTSTSTRRSAPTSATSTIT